MSRPLVIYHSNCPDGFTAAWVAARALGEVELFEGRYGEEPPYDLARGRDVYVVDFSYPREQLERLWVAAHGETDGLLRVLDHHKTAEENLRGLHYCCFDMQRSGAGLAWDHFHPGEPRPWIVDYVEDRDLWRFALPESESVSLWIRSAPHTLESWDSMAATTLEQVLEQACGCARYLQHYVEDALRQAYPIGVAYQAPSHFGSPADLDLHVVRAVAVNLSYTGVSDVLNAALAKDTCAQVAIGWHVAADGQLNCSLRSHPGFDCSVVAGSFGGGGHAQASGFRLQLDHPLAQRLIRAGGS